MICIDTHLHFYESYDAELFLRSLGENLERVCAGCEKAGIVLERAGEPGFEKLLAEADHLSGVKVEAHANMFEYKLDSTRGNVYRGVQVACAERFEILGLFCSMEAEDGIPADEAVNRIRDAGGIPVLAWAPGKWMFSRRSMVEGLLKDCGVQSLFLGDTALRPGVWSEPVLMRQFRMKGGKVLCGSDPLPFAGQENVAGTYASKVNADSGADVVDRLRRCLQSDQVGLGFAGRRASLSEFLLRMLRHKLSRS